MAKDKKKKLTSITIADEFGNTQTINPTGKTGGYSYNSKTGVSTNVRTGEKSPALSAVGNNRVQDIRTIKNQQNGTNDIRTVKTEDTQKNLRDAENNLNLKTAERQKKESEIYKKAGQTFQTKFENPQTQTLTYDSKGKKKTALPEQKISPKEVRKQVSKEINEEQEAYDQWKWANYENNLAKANEEKIGLWDKTLGNITRGASSIFSPLVVGEDLEIKDEKGNKTYLPSKAELKQQAVQNSYGDNLIGGIAKAGGDILYGGGKMLGAAALDIPTAGVGGKSLYWTSMALDNYKQNINDGYSKDKSLKNTLTNTAIQYISDRMLGGLTKVTTGGEISELEKLVGNQLGKVMKDSVAKEYLSKMISEGASEGLEEILGAISDKVTLGKDIDIPDLIKRTAYSAALGAGTAGFVNASMSLPSTVMQGGMQNGDVSNSNDNVIPNTNQIREIVEQKNNGQIDAETANQRIAEVQNGTYEQNRIAERTIQQAKEQFDAVNQAEASGQIDNQTANIERQALTNTINQMTQQNETQERVVQEQQPEALNLQENVKEEKTAEKKLEEKNKIKEEVKALSAKVNEFVEKNQIGDGGLSKENRAKYEKMNKQISDLRYELETKHYKEISENNIKDDRKTSLEKPIYVQARKDTLKNKDIYDALSRASWGVGFNEDTAVDDILNGKNKNVTPQQLYEAFDKTRDELRKAYGDKITLYRVEGMQKQKATKNYGSSIEYTKQYGDNVKKYDIDIKDIVAINTNRTGKYEDIIVATGGIEKYLGNIKQDETIEEPKVKQPKVEEKPKQEKSKSTDSIKEIRQEVEEKTNKTMSKHIETSSKATNTVEDIKNMNYDDIVYDTKTHKASQEQAQRELQGKDIDTNINDIHAKFRGTERLTNVDSAKITELMKQTKALADEAAKNGNESERNKRMEQFRTLKGDYAVALSESGQFTEYAKVIKELDPETQIDVLKKVIEKEQRRGNKKYEDVKINEELEKRYKEAKTDEERDAIMEEIKDDTARQIKITFADKANEFRFLSMLGNVKTHGRNFIGNVGMYSLQSFKDGVAAIGEDIYNKTSKNGLETRSKTLKPATKEVSNFVNEKVDSFLKDQKSKYNESRGMKGDLEERTKKFSDNNIIGKALNKASILNSRALDYEDRLFSSLMTKQAMKGFLTANGIETNADIEAHPELVAQALDYALFKGKEATFHQDSTTATAIRNLRDKLYTGSGFSKLGGLAIDTTLPFVSTPANIAKNALEYTPIIGFGDINTQLKNAPDNMKANVFIDSLSKQFTGGALMAVGAYLASQGLVKGSGDDDKEDKTEASLGNASYSIKIGNSTYDLSWLSPTAIPFFEGVEVFNAYKKANSKGGIKATDTADLIDTMFGTLNPMTDMSVLQSIERVITSITYGGNAVKSAASTTFSSYLQQYIPTLLSQIAQVGDTKQRNTNTGGNVLEKTWDQIQYKIPGRRNTLPEKVDVWGDTNKTASNIWQRGFEAFLSPANRKDYKVDNTTKELERLARETDDTAMLPTVKNKKLRVNGEDYDLKGKDYVNLQKTYGKTAKENLDELIESDVYKNADDNEKKGMVSKLYDYASYKAKEKYAKNKGIDFDSGTQTSFAMIDAFEIPYEKYVENQVSGNDSASKMLDKLNGAGLSEAQKGAVMNYFDRAYYVNEDELYNTLDNSDLSDKQKELIRTKYKNSITDKERERYQRADNIGVDYDLYTNFRSFVNSARGESRTGGPTKKQKVINWIQDQELTAQQKQNLYNDYINNQGIFSYYK